ncbi:NADH-quinone oxidoreductase subunit NuoF [Picosynechococcus sp. PCC 8807]|uniref:NADH-quinone oxidoreductase subunit NuoF n=1 Tax=Picosynechococcus sp. PCC 8807 TaxID=195248 RepID=UPI000810CAAB|nr:NADH-quinone oxidoreductase subunit NuoF [Picosynechococcus sp. PCC 8807]ANV89353.1 NADH dehydrogenase [Picosynechococcus sp. PCC 8807]
MTDLAELFEIAEAEQDNHRKIQIRCCTAAGCMSSGSLAVKEELEKRIKEKNLGDRLEVVPVGCMKLCGFAPLVDVSEETCFQQVMPEIAPEIVDVALGETPSNKLEICDRQAPFFTLQKPVVLENSGKIDPERIEAYIARGGYRSLHQVLEDLTPMAVVEEITQSGLRGRGGGGYPTGLKWATVAKMPGDQKYVVCNADEGDPGAFMDRAVLESDPHRVLEGMAIAGYAVGANHGYIYIRAEYPLAIQRLEKAIKQAKSKGLLGSQIFNSPFNFTIDIRIGAGAFVCGEETALIASIEGGRGTPRPRPPYPAQSGLWGHPTLINNVETYANIVPIIREGADWFSSIGTEKSKGTKVFALTGKVTNNGLIEVPMGTPVRQIVEQMGGGIPDGGTVKSVQTGGPSGGCIPADYLDTPIEYDSLIKLGTMMGSGGMIVMDEATSMVDVAKFYMEFCQCESCGKCIPCRAGTVQMSGLLSKMLKGQAAPKDIELLEQLCHMVKEASLCGLGQSAPNPILSTLRYFRDEYESLVGSAPD